MTSSSKNYQRWTSTDIRLPPTMEASFSYLCASTPKRCYLNTTLQGSIVSHKALQHLTSSRQQLIDDRSVEPSTTVAFVNSQQADAQGQGEVVLQVQTSKATPEATLRYVLHVPEAAVKLFSTWQATNSGVVIPFMNTGCSVAVDGTMNTKGIRQEDGPLVITQSDTEVK